jgi:CDP-glucose 4,6-dehydratase
MIDTKFWKNKRVFITGHTGFKGSWLCIWLHLLGAHVTGYALKPPTDPSLFELACVDRLVTSVTADVRNLDMLKDAILFSDSEIVIHMAAQPLVRDSYKIPVETYAINVMGTLNVLEAIRNCKSVKALINVTTDKCYENKENIWGYRENDPLGGYDPYSSSKACSELVTAAYRRSYLDIRDIRVATARAGNVIGGGDWATDRLVPDCIRSLLKEEKVMIRNPEAIRPWQYVLEPLAGYLILAENLYNTMLCSSAWNFGPNECNEKSVLQLVEGLCSRWSDKADFLVDQTRQPHEAHYLKLDSTKARTYLGWRPIWNLDRALDLIVEWANIYREKGNIMDICIKQIEDYMREVEYEV